jgi:F420-dependent oxidoreductase-like protein
VTRFGLQIPSFSFGGPDAEIFDNVSALARAAEDSGYDSVWVMDHLYQLDMLGGADNAMLEGYTLLGALAAVTERVELGTLVTGVTYRNPALLGQEVITLDVISKGRAWCGIGAAWHEEEHKAHGFEFPPIKERLDRVEEAVQILRGMFTSDGSSFEGTHYRTENLRTVPKPIRPGGPPIMIGGSGKKRTLKLVAKHADACNIFGDPETVRELVGILHGHCETVGRDPSEIEVTRLSTMLIAESQEQSDQLKEMVLANAGPERAPMMQVGTEDEIAQQISDLEAAGVQHFIFNMPGQGPDTVRRAADLIRGALAD